MKKIRFSYRGVKYNPETAMVSVKKKSIPRDLSYRGQKYDLLPDQAPNEQFPVRKSYRGIVY